MTLEPEFKFPDVSRGIEDLKFDPTGRRLVGLSRTQLVLWDPATGHEMLSLRCRTGALDFAFNPQLAFSSDGRSIAASQFDDTVAVWTAEADDGFPKR
jgi:WD40 repeat protein